MADSLDVCFEYSDGYTNELLTHFNQLLCIGIVVYRHYALKHLRALLSVLGIVFRRPRVPMGGAHVGLGGGEEDSETSTLPLQVFVNFGYL